MVSKLGSIILFLAFSFPSEVINQTMCDSLLMRLQSSEDSLKPAILNQLSWEYRNSFPEKSIEYGLQAINLAEQFNDFENLVKAYGFVGVSYRILGNYSEALDYFYKGLGLAKLYRLTEQEGYAYINIANLLIYQEFYKSALENLTRALDIAVSINNSHMKAYVYLNTGRALLLEKKYPEALENLFISLEIRKTTNQISLQAVSYKYIGDAYFDVKDYDKGLNNYELVLKTVDFETDKDLVANVHIKMAEIYLQLNDFSKARFNAEKSLSIAKNIGAKLLIRDSYKTLSRVFSETGNYKLAAEMMSSVIAYNDTLFNQQLSEKIFNLEYRYEKEIKQAEIDLLNKDIEINELIVRRTRITSIALGIILILLAGILIFYLRSNNHRKKQNKLLKRQKEELKLANHTKDKMFMIIGHDLRGPVGSLIPLLDHLIAEDEIKKNEKLLCIFNSYLKSLLAVTDLLENLLFWARKQGGELPFTQENVNLNLLIEKVFLLYKGIADLKQIELSATLEKDFIVFADRNMLMHVIRNLVSNALKFTPKHGKIEITMQKHGNYVEMCVKDNGVGFDETTSRQIFNADNFFSTTGTGNETGSGLGLILCKEFIEKNGGKIWAESEKGKGSTFYLLIPSA